MHHEADGKKLGAAVAVEPVPRPVRAGGAEFVLPAGTFFGGAGALLFVGGARSALPSARDAAGANRSDRTFSGRVAGSFRLLVLGLRHRLLCGAAVGCDRKGSGRAADALCFGIDSLEHPKGDTAQAAANPHSDGCGRGSCGGGVGSQFRDAGFVPDALWAQAFAAAGLQPVCTGGSGRADCRRLAAFGARPS